jgi:hypothetical protein
MCIAWAIIAAAGMPAHAQEPFKISAATIVLAAAGQAEAPAKDTPESADNVAPAKIIPETPAPEAPVFEPPIVKSLFYTQDEMEQIRQALVDYAQYLARKNSASSGDDFLKQLESKGGVVSTVVPKNKFYTYPQFFLEALGYHSPKDWTVRVNHQRITQDTKDGAAGNIRIVAIEKDKVSIEWEPEGDSIEKIDWKSGKTSDSRVTLNSTKKTVTFTLHANQTFSTYAMQILEGKVTPITIKVAGADGVPAGPQANAPANPKQRGAAQPRTQAGQTGLHGLLNAYKSLEEPNP